MADSHAPVSAMKTTILPVDTGKITCIKAIPGDDLLDDLEIDLNDTEDAQHIRYAASQLKTSNIPVAFPTETVYGLGADATRSSAVQGIYKAKQRPADNPLIVHFASLKQLRDVLRPNAVQTNGHVLAPEVTAGLSTFGARIPANILALALIKFADVPVAAPSANASTKPSPTAAEHVKFDLDGRIEIIIDGGLCEVGVESTVVDGLSSPPMILRPGGVSLEQLRTCPGWENVRIGYKNSAEEKPKAPGMKYRHYSPKAKVVLYESEADAPSWEDIKEYGKVGMITTRCWKVDHSNASALFTKKHCEIVNGQAASETNEETTRGFARLIANTLHATPVSRKGIMLHRLTRPGGSGIELFGLALGPDTAGIARGVFAALRELDRVDVDVILVEGIDEAEGTTAAAIMNRLRKAAEVNVPG
ncbi:hypothetical protein LTR97_012845 [Elasticomyces elasticus]|uniref:Threonylcarbamoyl-AMP synthase n=1 Tax=Elasticomyces elasticus TaxID=574655 RepID=A0AAN7ZQ94_9PEZI|nr:hypothetical protein LTR97_012845 [Elasticomyces elasticus]